MNSTNVVEALLFVADAPATRKALAEAAGVSEAEVERALDALRTRLEGTSLTVVEIAGGYQLCTRESYAEAIGNFLQPQRQKLSRSLMEVLAIVAYRQPITQSEIDAVRGVQSDYGVRGLLERRLIHEVGRRESPGRPVLYGTTQQFLHQFNLNDLGQLPELHPDALDAPLQPALPEGEPASSSFE